MGRTVTEEEILYHEGRAKMRKKDHEHIAAFKQSIWQVRALLFYGEVERGAIEITLSRIFEGKVKD